MSNEEKTKSKKRSKEKNQTLTVLQLMKKKNMAKIKDNFPVLHVPATLAFRNVDVTLACNDHLQSRKVAEVLTAEAGNDCLPVPVFPANLLTHF